MATDAGLIFITGSAFSIPSVKKAASDALDTGISSSYETVNHLCRPAARCLASNLPPIWNAVETSVTFSPGIERRATPSSFSFPFASAYSSSLSARSSSVFSVILPGTVPLSGISVPDAGGAVGPCPSRISEAHPDSINEHTAI